MSLRLCLRLDLLQCKQPKCCGFHTRRCTSRCTALCTGTCHAHICSAHTFSCLTSPCRQLCTQTHTGSLTLILKRTTCTQTHCWQLSTFENVFFSLWTQVCICTSVCGGDTGIVSNSSQRTQPLLSWHIESCTCTACTHRRWKDTFAHFLLPVKLLCPRACCTRRRHACVHGQTLCGNSATDTLAPAQERRAPAAPVDFNSCWSEN